MIGNDVTLRSQRWPAGWILTTVGIILPGAMLQLTVHQCSGRINFGNFVIVLMMYYDITTQHISMSNRSFSRSVISSSSVATNMWTLASTSPVSLHRLYSRGNPSTHF